MEDEEMTLFAIYQGGLIFGFAIMMVVTLIYIADGWIHPQLNRAVVVAGIWFVIGMIARYKYKRIIK